MPVNTALTATPIKQSIRPAYLEVRNLTKSYGRTSVLKDVSFTIDEGEFVCFLGPSGCGKTTLLLCLAGLEHPSSGDMIKKGEGINDLPPSKRDVGIVFQSYALFPNLDVVSNIGFGLVNQNKPKKFVQEAATKLISLLSLSGHEKKFPSQLSGGQQQRVALARALAVSPSLLLLDEPLSALDAQVRTRLRTEIRDLQIRLGITTIMVTHDQEEAQILSDKIILMNQGRIEQIGTPWEIYNQPRTPFVADFIGVSNLLTGHILDTNHIEVSGLSIQCPEHTFANGQAITALIRPEDIVLSAVRRPHVANASSEVKCDRLATITKVEYLGAIVRLELNLAQTLLLKVDVSKKAFSVHQLAMGQQFEATIPAEHIQLFAS